MHLFLELAILLAFGLAVAHTVGHHGREGGAFFLALAFLGFVRENFVALYDLLYGFAPLHLQLGKAPLIAAVIWGFSIYTAVTWCDAVGWGSAFRGDGPPETGSGWRLYAGSAVFMIALAAFYEPFLELVGMARWEEGTRTVLGAQPGAPWIALVGYPTLTVAFLWLWRRRGRLPPGLAGTVLAFLALAALALVHGWGLQAVKRVLGW